MKKKYFEYMRETAQVVDPILRQSLDSIKYYDVDLYSVLEKGILKRVNKVKKKRGRPKLRPMLVRIAYECVGGEDWEKIANVAAASEILNISTYATDYIFDLYLSEEEVINNIFRGILYREISQELIEKLLEKTLSFDQIFYCNNKLSEIVKTVYLGQYLDLKRMDRKASEEDYFTRCYQIGGVFYKALLSVGSFLGKGTTKQVRLLEEIGTLHGTSMQILNDLTDYTSQEFEDLKKGKFTLPLIYLWKNSTEAERKDIEQMIKEENFFELFSQIRQSGGFEYTRKKILNYYDKLSLLIRDLEATDIKNSKILREMIKVLNNNKAFKYLEEN